MNLTKEIGRAFGAQALTYEKMAKVQMEIGERLFARLSYLKITPRYILDLGCGPGMFSKRLKQYYPKARIIALDVAYPMLKAAKHKQSLLNHWPLVQAHMSELPFATGIFDLVFANQAIHWVESLPQLFAELNRVMRVGGCLMFSTLGPDTFLELKTQETHQHANEFQDMHDIGDLLLSDCFLDPVMDMEMLTAHYASVSALFRALKQQGVKNIHPKRNRGLTGKVHWEQFCQSVQSFETADGKIPLTYEVVYGHAWKGEKRRVNGVIESVLPFPTSAKSSLGE